MLRRRSRQPIDFQNPERQVIPVTASREPSTAGIEDSVEDEADDFEYRLRKALRDFIASVEVSHTDGQAHGFLQDLLPRPRPLPSRALDKARLVAIVGARRPRHRSRRRR
jgi:hypothetical protein